MHAFDKVKDQVEEDLDIDQIMNLAEEVHEKLSREKLNKLSIEESDIMEKPVFQV